MLLCGCLDKADVCHHSVEGDKCYLAIKFSRWGSWWNTTLLVTVKEKERGNLANDILMLTTHDLNIRKKIVYTHLLPPSLTIVVLWRHKLKNYLCFSVTKHYFCFSVSKQTALLLYIFIASVKSYLMMKHTDDKQLKKLDEWCIEICCISVD